MEANGQRSEVITGFGEKLPRKEILRGKKNFAYLYTHGKKIRGSILLCYTSPLPFCRSRSIKYYFAISVNKKVGSAFYRNRIKRWVREAYRKNKKILYNCVDKINQPLAILFVCNKVYPGITINYTEINSDIKKILQNIIELISH